MGQLFEVFNANSTKTGEVTQYTPLEVKTNRHKEQINTAVMGLNLNNTDVFLGYNWLVKHNSEVNWNTGTI